MADTPRRALTLRDLMTSRLVAASPDESVADAAEAMVRQRVGSALIMQGSFLAGILTERDVLRAAASGSDLTASPVSAWMTKDPEQASLDTTIEDAAQLMLLHGFRHLPVVEGREVRGVVSLRDLAAARITRPASGGAGQTVAHLPVNKSQSVNKRRIYRSFFTSGEKFTSREIFTGKAAGSWGA